MMNVKRRLEKLVTSPNAEVIVIGSGKDGLPIILDMNYDESTDYRGVVSCSMRNTWIDEDILP